MSWDSPEASSLVPQDKLDIQGRGKKIPKQRSSLLGKKRHTPGSFEIEEIVILSRYRKYLINIC